MAIKTGDIVHHRAVPAGLFDVEVLEVKPCTDEGVERLPATCGKPSIRYQDPESGLDDWEHAEEFELVRRP